MTTIAYKDGIMAADSGLYDVGSGMYLGTVQKIYRLKDGSLLGTSGDGDARALIALLDSLGAQATPDALLDTGVGGSFLLVEPDGRVYYVDIEQSEHIHQKGSASLVEVKHTHYAVGAGTLTVMGAMLAGKSAKDAVALTVKENVWTSLPVQVEKL